MTDKVKPSSEHSDIIGGSIAARRIFCPGSYELEKKIPKAKRASTFAERGTALHEAMEDYLLNCDDLPVSCLLGVEYNGFIIDQDMIDTKIVPALAALDEITAAAGGDLDFMIEVRADLSNLIPGTFGTVDILGVGADKKLWVIDWKFGDGVPVSPIENFQMGFYAAAALYDTAPDVQDLVSACGDGGVEQFDIVFAIVQPRVGHDDEPNWAMWETDTLWVNQFAAQLVRAHEKMLKPNAPLSTGDHCRWCRAQTTCPLKQKQITSFADTKVAPGLMDGVTLAHWLDQVAEVETFIKELKTFAHAEADRGLKVPGWKVVKKRPARVYDDPKAAATILIRHLKSEEAHKPKEIITPSQAEKKLGKEKYQKLLAKSVSMVSSGTTLARDTDKRPDVSNPSKSLGNKLRETLGKVGAEKMLASTLKLENKS